MDIWIPIPVQRTVVTSRAKIRAAFVCKHCGFTATARVVGVGSISTPDAIALGPAPQASLREQVQSRERAVADAQELLALVPCPGCGRRGSEAWAAYTRQTRILQAIVAALLLVVVYALWDKDNPAPAVVFLIPAIAVVFVAGYLRGVRAELPADRVTFLSAEEAAAEEAPPPRRKPSKKSRRAEEPRPEPREEV
jgi:hypothetical protein